MKEWIISHYLTPKSPIHQFFYGLNKHFYLWSILLCSVVVSYPLFCTVKNYLEVEKNYKNSLIINEKIVQSYKLLANMRQYYQHKNQSELQFTQINNQLNTLFERYHIQPEILQWQLEQQNMLYLTVNQQSNIVFNLLDEISRIPNLFAKEITLTKLNQQRFIQLNATLILIQ